MKLIIAVVRMQSKLEAAGLNPGPVFAGNEAFAELEREFKASRVVAAQGLKRIEDCLNEFHDPIGHMYIRNSLVRLVPTAEPSSLHVGVRA